MAIMVTGGTGFIGSRIVRNLLEKGETVVSFDTVSYTNLTLPPICSV